MTATSKSAKSAEKRLTTTENGIVKPVKPKIDVSKLPPLESAADFMKRNIPPLQHIVEGMFTEGVGLLAAREKTGKSWFCYQLAQCVALGKSFLGHKTQKGQCLYFDLENQEGVRQERLGIMFPGGVSEDIFFIDAPSEEEPWIIGEGFEDVVYHFLEQAPKTKLIIIDVLDTVVDDQKRNESPKRHAYRNIRRLKAIARGKHLAIICVMHFRKMTDPDDFMSNISGSNGWAAAADYAGGITKKRGEREGVFQTDGRTCRSVEMSIYQDDKTMIWKQQGTLEEMMERKRIEGFKNNDITKTIVSVVKMGNGVWKGTSDMLIAETVFPTDNEEEGVPTIQASARAVTSFITGNVDLFRTVYGISVIDRNQNNSKTADWIITMLM